MLFYTQLYHTHAYYSIGSNAVSLLANYYKENDDNLGEFLKQAVLNNHDRPYLLDMVRLCVYMSLYI